MCNNHCHPLSVAVRRLARVIEDWGQLKSDKTPVLHCSSGKIRYCNKVCIQHHNSMKIITLKFNSFYKKLRYAFFFISNLNLFLFNKLFNKTIYKRLCTIIILLVLDVIKCIFSFTNFMQSSFVSTNFLWKWKWVFNNGFLLYDKS